MVAALALRHADGVGTAPLLRLCGGAPSRMPNFHGQRRAPPPAPPPDLASAVAAIIGLEQPAATRGAGSKTHRRGGRGRGAAVHRGRAGESVRRGSKRVEPALPAADTRSEGSPGKKSRVSDGVSRHTAGVGHAETCAAAGDAEADSFSHMSSIEVELPVQPSQDVRGEDQPVEGRVSNIVASAAHTMRGMHGGR